MCLSWPRILVTAGTYSILRRNKVILSSLCQGSNRIDSFGFANFWIAKVNHFIFDSDSFWFTFKANESQWFILIQFDFDFDSLWFTIHLDFHSFLFAIQIDSLSKRTNRNDSFWFVLILILRESRFTRESWFTCVSKSNRIKNQR